MNESVPNPGYVEAPLHMAYAYGIPMRRNWSRRRRLRAIRTSRRKFLKTMFSYTVKRAYIPDEYRGEMSFPVVFKRAKA